MKNNLNTYLKLYREFQKDITLVSRETGTTWWGNRVKYLDEDFNSNKFPFYNHRSVLECEAVIEYDNPDKYLNLRLIKKAEEQIKRDGLDYAIWFTGGKSYHLHVLFDVKSASRISLLKKVILRYYGTLYIDARNHIVTESEYKEFDSVKQDKYVRMLPDLRMSDNNHLVRAEYGLHEGSGNKKGLIRKTVKYGECLSVLPSGVWQSYSDKITAVIKRKVSEGVGQVIDSPEVKLLLSTTDFKKFRDGKKRALFILINLLKKNRFNPEGKYDKTELVDVLWDWYKYVGGYELTKNSIAGMVGYYWTRDYSRMGVGYIREVLEELGHKVENK